MKYPPAADHQRKMDNQRHLAAILKLPFVALVVIPALILALGTRLDTRWDTHNPAFGVTFFVGMVLIFAGMWLLCISVYLFKTIGKGTLAPWDRTHKLVVTGPYRFVRNPMITGVVAALAGESLITGSVISGCWTATFFLANHVYFILAEEPGLEKHFGDDYREYKKKVPRWIPRQRPWAQKDAKPAD